MSARRSRCRLPSARTWTASRSTAIAAAFAQAHHRVFEFSKPPGDPVEIVSFRLGARARTEAFPVYQEAVPEGAGENSGPVFIDIVEGGRPLRCRLMPRHAVGSTDIAGPVLVEDGTSTIYVPPGWQAQRDDADSLILKREA